MPYQYKSYRLLGVILAMCCTFNAALVSASEPQKNITDDALKIGMENAEREKERASHLLSPGLAVKQFPSPALRIENLPAINTNLPRIDVGKITDSWKNLTSTNQDSTTKIKVFVSFSMPDESIRKIIDQAHLIGRDSIQISLIGLLEENNMKLTLSRIAELTKGKDVEFLIDPDGFEKFAVNQVPALVVYRDDPLKEAQCSVNGDDEGLSKLRDYIGVYGDVTIEYALEHLRKTELDWQDEVSVFLERVSPSLSSYRSFGD